VEKVLTSLVSNILLMSPTRVLIVNDHLAFADAVALRLQAEADLVVVGCVTSLSPHDLASRRGSVDVAVVDIEVGQEAAMELVAKLRSSSGDMKVIALIADGDAQTASAAVRAGASGFVTKAVPAGELIDAIRSVERNETWIDRRLLTDVLQELQQTTAPTHEEVMISKLTPREREVLSLMLAGLDRAQIARRLVISHNTVRTHTRNLLRKLEVHSSIEAVGLALRGGVHPPNVDE
jgi:DNA-binding NarL/FixJ family response regulator